MTDIGNGYGLLNFVWCFNRYRVPCGVYSYLVMYYGDKGLGHLSGVCPVHSCLRPYCFVFDDYLFSPCFIYMLASREKWHRVTYLCREITCFTQLQMFTQKTKLLHTWSNNLWRPWGLVTLEQSCYFAISFPIWNFLAIHPYLKGQGLPTAQNKFWRSHTGSEMWAFSLNFLIISNCPSISYFFYHARRIFSLEATCPLVLVSHSFVKIRACGQSLSLSQTCPPPKKVVRNFVNRRNPILNPGSVISQSIFFKSPHWKQPCEVTCFTQVTGDDTAVLVLV
jgi:hypothetical protein